MACRIHGRVSFCVTAVIKKNPTFHAVKAESGWAVTDDTGAVIATYPGRGKGKAEAHAGILSRGVVAAIRQIGDSSRP